MIAVIAAHLNLHQYWDNPDQRSFMNSGHDIDREGSRKQKTVKLEIGVSTYGQGIIWCMVCMGFSLSCKQCLTIFEMDY